MSIKSDPDNYCIYVHIAPNGKMYIGTTGMILKERWNHGRGYKRCPLFNKAITQYGWDNFQHIVLIEGLNRDVAYECEKALVAKYHTNHPDYGYNLSGGGKGSNGYKHTEEQRKRQSEISKGRKLSEEAKRKIGENSRRALTGRHLPEEVKRKISASNKGKPGRPQTEEAKRKNALAHMGKQYHLGYKHSKESRKKMSLAKLGKPLTEAQKAQLDRLHQLMRDRRTMRENL